MKRFSIDSNILIYAEGTDDLEKRDIVVPLIKRIGSDCLFLTMQAAGETLRWLINKGKVEKKLAVEKMQLWLAQSTALPMTATSFHAACSIIEQHSLQVWDAAILAASAEAGSDVLLSEDMQHGFQWRSVTIVNPFKLTAAERLILVPENTVH